MSKQIEAKPTEYAGITFRSRLEARWAVFFDELDMSWIYEPSILGSSFSYVPDFRLDFPFNNFFYFEIKPAPVTPEYSHELAEIGEEYFMKGIGRLHLAVGTFYNQDISITLLRHPLLTNNSSEKFTFHKFMEKFINDSTIADAIKATRTYRFDLA